MNWLIRQLASFLSPSDREAVLGDLAEQQRKPSQVLYDLLDLVLHRSLEPWSTDFRPWLALLGVVLPCGYLLSRLLMNFFVGFAMNTNFYVRYGVWLHSGFTSIEEIIFCVLQGLAIGWWAYLSGLVVGRLSPRTSWLALPLFCLVATMQQLYRTGRMPSIHLFLPAVVVVTLGGSFVKGITTSFSVQPSSRHSIKMAAWSISAAAISIGCIFWQQHALDRWSLYTWHPHLAWHQPALIFAILSSPAIWLFLRKPSPTEQTT